MWIRLVARLLLPLGVNLNWVFAPRAWVRSRRVPPRSLQECQREAAQGHHQG